MPDKNNKITLVEPTDVTEHGRSAVGISDFFSYGFFTCQYFFRPNLDDRMGVLSMVNQPQRQRLNALLGRIQFLQSFVQTDLREAGHDVLVRPVPTCDINSAQTSSTFDGRHHQYTTSEARTVRRCRPDRQRLYTPLRWPEKMEGEMK